jgi:hypothetical protein
LGYIEGMDDAEAEEIVVQRAFDQTFAQSSNSGFQQGLYRGVVAYVDLDLVSYGYV